MRTPCRRGWLAGIAAAATVLAPAAAFAAPVTHPAAAHPTGVPVRVVVTGDGTTTVATLVKAAGGTAVSPLDVVGGVSATVPQGAVAALRATPGIRSVTADAGLHLLADAWTAAGDQGSLTNVAARIGATAGYPKGDTGQGVGVALVDSGVTMVPGLDQPGTVVQGPDLSLDSQQPNLNQQDAFGHGTHLAGIIAGHDAGPIGSPAAFDGIAPGAHVVSIKVAAADGSTDVSQVIAGIDWAVAHRNDPGVNIRVLNLSFGTESTQPYLLDPLAFAVENAWHKGIVVVVSAGNDGTAAGHLTDPGYDPLVLSVGASDATGAPASFTSGGSATRSPDLLSPGVSIDSLRDPGSFIDRAFPTGEVTTPSAPGNVDTSRLFRGSGTSQAAAVTSGAVALLLQARPNLNPDQVKAILKSSARPVAGVPTRVQGSGDLDLAKALTTPAPFFATQLVLPATGLGSLEAARGGDHLVDPTNGVALVGERDVFGHPWVAPAWVVADTLGVAWKGGSYLGTTLTGTSWSGSRWDGSRWDASRWDASRWDGSRWDGVTWSGSRWDTVVTADAAWSGSRWDGSRWDASRWDASRWDASRWDSSRWDGSRWDGSRWDVDGWQTVYPAPAGS